MYLLCAYFSRNEEITGRLGIFVVCRSCNSFLIPRNQTVPYVPKSCSRFVRVSVMNCSDWLEASDMCVNATCSRDTSTRKWRTRSLLCFYISMTRARRFFVPDPHKQLPHLWFCTGKWWIMFILTKQNEFAVSWSLQPHGCGASQESTCPHWHSICHGLNKAHYYLLFLNFQQTNTRIIDTIRFTFGDGFWSWCSSTWSVDPVLRSASSGLVGQQKKTYKKIYIVCLLETFWGNMFSVFWNPPENQ